jgi:D-lactate dehydrogenase
MKVAVFGAKAYDIKHLSQENRKFYHDLVFLDVNLNAMTATLARGFNAVCAFVNDELDEECLKKLSENGVRTVALRCAGFNNVDLDAASVHNITVVRVPD